jgi:F0F1-type ATP synthase assembly protein I
VGSERKPVAAAYAQYSYLAMLLPVSTFVGYVIGHYLDKVFATSWLTVLFLILGTVGGFIELIRQILRDSKNDRTG